MKRFTRSVSIALTIVFLASQSRADLAIQNDTLAAPSGFSMDNGALKGAVTQSAHPGAIGNGRPLFDLTDPSKLLPPRIPFDTQSSVADRIRAAIDIALTQYESNIQNIPDLVLERLDSSSENIYLRDFARETYERLINFKSFLSKDLYPFNSIVDGMEAYLVGFNFDMCARKDAGEAKAALAIDFIEWLLKRYDNNPKVDPCLRIAQYIFHEMTPERTIIKKGAIDRGEHKMIYEKLQGAIFTDKEVEALKADLREFINAMAAAVAVRFHDRVASVAGDDAGFIEAIDAVLSNDAVNFLLSHGFGECSAVYDAGQNTVVVKIVLINPADPTDRVVNRIYRDDVGAWGTWHYHFVCHFAQSFNITSTARLKEQLSCVLNNPDGGGGMAKLREWVDAVQGVQPGTKADIPASAASENSGTYVERMAALYGALCAELEDALPQTEARPSASEAPAGAAGVDRKVAITRVLPRSVEIFKQTLMRFLKDPENDGQLFFFGFENDIGAANNQKEEVQSVLREIEKTIEALEKMKDSSGKKLFPNLITKRGSADALAAKIRELHEDKKDCAPRLVSLGHAFISARAASIGTFTAITGEGKPWIAAVDDSTEKSEGRYLPVFEAMMLNIYSCAGADLEAIRELYNAIAETPVQDLNEIDKMRQEQIFKVIPKATKFDTTKELQDLYRLIADQIRSMA